MFPDYVKLVVQDYERKRATQALSSRLASPTPARLRDECLLVCKEQFQRKDEGILRTFFDTSGDQDHYLDTINNFDINRFRPLINFLRNPSITTDIKNINLLAWLIDFKDRPFELGKTYIVAEGNNNEITNPVAEEQDTPGQAPEEQEKKFPPPTSESPFGTGKKPDTKPGAVKPPTGTLIKKISLYTGILLLVICGLYIYYNNTSDKPTVMGRTLKGPEACMYWAGDHYEQVSCNEKKESLVIALDSFKLQHFRKITRPDTITQNHVGSVWYIKNGGDIEFYTAEGMHPVDIKKRLKPATAYIIDKYIISRTD